MNHTDTNVVSLNHTREVQLLSGLLTYPTLIDAHNVQPWVFGVPDHAEVFRWALKRINNDLPCDPMSLLTLSVSLGPALKAETDASDPAGVLREIAGTCTEYESVSRLLRDLQHLGARRRMEEAFITGLDAVRSGASTDEVVGEVLLAHETVRSTDDLGPQTADAGLKSMDSDWSRMDGGQMSVKSGIWQIDDHPQAGGFVSEGVTLFLMRSGMGKTTLLNRIALGTAARGIPVVMHGTETSVKARLWDLSCSVAGMTKRHLERLGSDANEHKDAAAIYNTAKRRVLLAQSWIRTLPIYLTGSGLNVDQWAGHVLALRRSGRLGGKDGQCLLIADYLQDFAPVNRPGLRPSDRTQQVIYASGRLKNLSTGSTMRCPLLVAAQVSGEKAGWDPKSDPRPMMWDCEWSAQVHKDAEEVIAGHREDYFRDKLGQQLWSTATYKVGVANTLELIWRKQRGGIEPTIEIPFVGHSKWCGGWIDSAPEQLRLGR